METNSMTRTRMFIGLKTSTNDTNIRPQEVKEVIREHVDAGTFYRTEGLWMGSFEDSIVFECVSLEDNFSGDKTAGISSVEQLKELLEREFDQDSVMVERTEVEVAF